MLFPIVALITPPLTFASCLLGNRKNIHLHFHLYTCAGVMALSSSSLYSYVVPSKGPTHNEQTKVVKWGLVQLSSASEETHQGSLRFSLRSIHDDVQYMLLCVLFLFSVKEHWNCSKFVPTPWVLRVRFNSKFPSCCIYDNSREGWILSHYKVLKTYPVYNNHRVDFPACKRKTRYASVIVMMPAW